MTERSNTPQTGQRRDAAVRVETSDGVTVVGGGLGGLVAAIEVARAGVPVTLHEGSAQLGGRARTRTGSYRTNMGPHALYRYGALGSWLEREQLMPEVFYPSLTGLRVAKSDRLHRLPLMLLPMMRSHRESAPHDQDYRSWARERLGADAAEAAIGFAALPTFHGDPGVLSAEFVQERIHRSSVWRPVYYIRGGWGEMLDRLVERARSLGVRIETRSKLSVLPDGPVIVATDMRTAARLFDDERIAWPGARNVMLDVALEARRSDPSAVLDLDRRIYVSNYSAGDPSLAPKSESLIQCCAGPLPGESDDAARERIRAVLDLGYPDWRNRTVWQRSGVLDAGAGASDPPGTRWQDRPAIDRGNGHYLVGDRVAAPGILSEVACESACRAAALVVERLGREAKPRKLKTVAAA